MVLVQGVVLALTLLGWANFTAAQDVNQWWVFSETRILPEPVPPNSWHRLANREGGQLRHGRQSPGIDLIWETPGAGNRNIKIHRMVHDPNYGDTPDVGSNVRLNEPVAIEIDQGGYLIYRKQEGLGLEWQEDSQLNPAWNSPDVYQWEFRSMSPQRRDHRTRDIRTKEHLALFNTVAGAYLVYGERRGIDLKWKK